jgi:hypothetical protein
MELIQERTLKKKGFLKPPISQQFFVASFITSPEDIYVADAFL